MGANILDFYFKLTRKTFVQDFLVSDGIQKKIVFSFEIPLICVTFANNYK